jgi:hypothetical protein
MFKENDFVKATRDLSNHVLEGDAGTVVLVYQKPSIAYEVEFINKQGETTELLTVQSSDISLSD